MTVAAILVAAGSGVRLGAQLPKAFCLVAGKTLLEHALERFVGHPEVADVVVVAPAHHLAEAIAIAGTATVVAGGETRQHSVANGLAALPDRLPEGVDAVLIHDVARPFVPAEVITRVITALRAGAVAVIPALPVTDTIKRVDGDDLVVDTLARNRLRAVQTPQGFRRSILVAAHAAAVDAQSTDDAALVEAAGHPVVVVEGADESFKITRPWDLVLAEAVAS